MQNNDENRTFEYTYSASEREEVKKIRDRYINRGEDKLEMLRKLDKRVTQKAEVISLVFGIIGILILGFGMSLAMSELSEILGFGRNSAMLIGIITGVIGGVIASLAYPMYSLVMKREREKVAPEILRLSDELMK